MAIGKDGEIKKEIDLTALSEYDEYADQIEAVGSKIKLQADVYIRRLTSRQHI